MQPGTTCSECRLETHSATCPRRFSALRTLDGKAGDISLYLIRHGKTPEDDPKDPKFSGPGEIKLDDEGRQQAIEAAGWLAKNASIYWLLTSPIARAKESAELIGEKLDLVPRVFSAGRDWNNGAVAGHFVSKILPFVTFFERNSDLPIPGGEPYGAHWELQGRGLENLRTLPYEQLDIALSTHGRWIAMAGMRITKGHTHPAPTDFSLSPKPGGIVKISKGTDGGLKFELVHGDWNG